MQFKDKLIDWSDAALGAKFSTLNNIQQSRQMIKFFVLEVLEKLYPGLVPDDEGELEGCIVDGSGDGGADFLYRTDEGQVLIIQGKCRGKDTVESAEAVGRLCDLPERLLLATEGKVQGLHKEIVELASQIDWAEDSFRFYFITTAKKQRRRRGPSRSRHEPCQQFPDLIEERSEFRYLDNSA